MAPSRRPPSEGYDCHLNSQITHCIHTDNYRLHWPGNQFEQSVQLAQKVVKSQREVLALTAKLKEADGERIRLEQQVSTLNERLTNLHQPQAYLVRYVLIPT